MNKIYLISLFLFGLIFIGACTQNPKTVSPDVYVPPTKSEYGLAKDECESKDGKLIGCLTSTGYACSLPTKDGGTPCSDSVECEEQCVAPPNCDSGNANVIGTCAERTYLVCDGVQSVEDGKCGPITIA